MGFRYDRLKKKRESGQEFWASYADLYTMLSFVFLFLFAVANIRSGTGQMTNKIENIKLAKENEDLREQIKVYSTLKDNYLEQKATADEKETYQELMDKLTLLAQENKQEASDLRKQASENEKKERALNKYQQMIRNIMNSNLLAKQQINNRDLTITEKNKTLVKKEMAIKEQGRTISKLETDVAAKENEIAENQKKIEQVEGNLKQKIAAIQAERKKSKITAAQMKAQIEAVTSSSQQKIAALESAKNEVRRQLGQVESELAATSGQLSQAQGELRAKEGALAGAQAARDEARRKLGQMQGELNATSEQLAAAQGDLKAKEAALGAAEGEKNRALASVNSLKAANKGLSSDLEKAQAIIKAKGELVNQIKSEFAKKGIKAQVDAKSGDVTLDFGEEYFETNSYNLKPGMVQKLRGFFPAYAEALFKDKKLAKKVANVEIIGFASPTYNGRYVNPASMSPADQEAINYNLKLSFGRANSIFKYAFDQSKVTFNGQQALLPMVKVVGRGYLPEGVSSEEIPANMSEKEFCKRYNCKKAQRVIIKFNLQE